jgi:dolichol-phosphate mannosyltransferase
MKNQGPQTENPADYPPITVIIPAYCAETKIQSVLEGIPDYVNTIIVVDDCSPDQTAAIVNQQRLVDPRIVLVQHPQNQGVGGAMITGYTTALEAQVEIIIKMDSDGQMDPAFIPTLIAPLVRNEADFTKGNRFLHEKALRQMPWIRRIGNLGLSFLTKLASGYWNIFDPTNGFTAIRADALRILNLERLAKRYFFETSLLIELGFQRLVIRDVYIPALYQNENSSLSVTRSLLEFPPRLLVGMFRRIIYLYFIRDFTALTIFLIFGLVNVLFGSLWGAYYWWKSSVTGIAASTGTVMIAILPLTLGLQLLLQVIVMDIQNTPDRKN